MSQDAMQRYLIEEMQEEYREGHLNRREFVRRLALITGSMATAAALAACTPEPATSPAPAPPPSPAPAPLPAPAPAPAPAQPAGVTVPETDPAISAAMVEFRGEGGVKLLGYLARPSGTGPFPGVIVIHENRILVEHIKDVARRLAKEGYAALAPDMASREGGTAAQADSSAVTGILGRAPAERHVQDLLSAVSCLKGQAFVRQGGLGAVGFCWGGGVTWRLAVSNPDIAAAAPFYGPNPPLEQIPNLKAKVLAIYGENDQRINQGIPAVEEALKGAGKAYEIQVYKGAGHAFHNDTGQSYNKDAATDAWQKVLSLFAQTLKG